MFKSKLQQEIKDYNQWLLEDYNLIFVEGKDLKNIKYLTKDKLEDMYESIQTAYDNAYKKDIKHPTPTKINN